MVRGFFPITMLMLIGPGVAVAADSSTLTSMELYATIQAASVVARISGDDDKDATAKVRYRVKGSASFTEGHPLVRLSGGPVLLSMLSMLVLLAPRRG